MKIKKLRTNNNILQKEIAEKLHISQNTYSQYEKGIRTPSLDLIPKLAEILNCTVEEVVFALIEAQQQNLHKKGA